MIRETDIEASMITELGHFALILAFVVAYLLMCVGVGVWALRRTTSTRDFFMAGRDLGVLVTGLAAPRRAARSRLIEPGRSLDCMNHVAAHVYQDIRSCRTLKGTSMAKAQTARFQVSAGW